MKFTRYSAGAVLTVLGFWVAAGGMLAGSGVHERGNPAIGTAMAVVGLAMCVGAYDLVRQLRGEAIYRQTLNAFLLSGFLGIGTFLIHDRLRMATVP